MRKNTYIVTFHVGEPITVSAWNEAEARILAQAERINAGMKYLIKSVEKVND